MTSLRVLSPGATAASAVLHSITLPYHYLHLINLICSIGGETITVFNESGSGRSRGTLHPSVCS